MADVFISHAREDHASAERLAKALRSRGWSVWLDSQLTAGERWDAVIELQLAAAKCVVVLWSAHSVASNWVRNEARRGLQNRRLVPAKLASDVPIPVEFDGEQTADLSNWRRGDADLGFLALIAGIARLLGTRESPDAVARPGLSPARPALTRRSRIYLLAALLVLAAGGLAYLRPWTTQPLVLLMDSQLPEMAYDDNAAASGRTNAAVIGEILRDLPVSLASESTTVEWHREDEIRRLDPSLIIIHSSAFYSRTSGSDNGDRLIALLDSMKTSSTQFLIYTRVVPMDLEQAVRDRIPLLGARVYVWQVPGGASASFAEPATQRTLKDLVAKMLNL